MAVRPKLNRATVIDRAADVVDEDGWQLLTITALAKRIGVQGPSLYNHVESLDDVLGELQVRAHEDIAQRLQRAAMGKVGRDALRSIASALHGFATDHPGLFDLAMRTPIDLARVVAASEPSSAALAAVVASFGVTDLSNELFMSCVAGFYGAIALEQTGLFAAVDTDAVFERAIDMVNLMLEAEGRLASDAATRTSGTPTAGPVKTGSKRR